ncbi:rRNA-processing protein bfr2 [Ceratocystis pirilliformis]|uniref:Protein BFR2 n=1 Tax=Ceratocystis pirilliformis TaxID=259994 RepID=A0ABR3YIC9_9PEZI
MKTKLRGRARQFAQLEEKPKTDYDPEAENVPSENENDDGESEDENAGTEHYVQVGKSKLRKSEGLSLGHNYRGTRVSRKAFEEDDNDLPQDDSDDSDDSEENDEEEEFDDPDMADLEKDQARITNDELIDSDDAFVESDQEFTEKFIFRGSSKPKSTTNSRKNRPKAVDFMPESDQDGGEEDFQDAQEELDDEDDDEVGGSKIVVDGERSEESDDFGSGEDDDSEEDEDDDRDDEEDEEGEEDEDEDEDEEDKTTNRNFNANDHLSSLSAAAKQEALKGMAVRGQRKLFDGLLNFRIRLQKALVSANTLLIADQDTESTASDEDAAEQAAIQLWNTLDSIRTDFTNSAVKGSQKRKRQIDSSTATKSIWGFMQEDEAESLKYRRVTLDKWSRRVGPSAVASRDRLKSTNNSICVVLDEQLSEPSRLIKRTQIPRSCAPAHAAKKISEDTQIYDDADFYQLLLKELVEQRTTETDQAAGTAVATVRWAAMKEAKTRKIVDRKASRGRKLKFTVHEKLQSFMAPEDRRQWEEEAVDRLFNTLLGQQVALDEEDEQSNAEDEDAEIDAEEEGLKLFRS